LVLARVFKEEKPQLIHLCNSFHGNLDGIIAARLVGIPCICHIKGFYNYTWFDRLFARLVDLGICMTEAVRQDCQRHEVSAKRMTVIYDGLDLESFCPSLDPTVVRKKLGISPEVPVVGIVGNIKAWKGQAVVVEAIREVKTVLPDIYCLIVGEVQQNGYARDIHKFVEEHGLQKNVIFTGFREDIAELMSAMDIVIHASVKPEPFGRVILEGMTLGKAVIATNLGGVPEFVQDSVTGRLVPPSDSRALAAVIVELIRDSAQRQRLGHNARQQIHQRFSMQHHVEEITSAYSLLGH
jgi:glycosyltransferase involved in cell wall biosynthesis